MDIYGLLGYPLGHSFSRGFFNEKFTSERIDAEYVNFEIPDINEVRSILAAHPHLKGLNVTIPYKEKILPYLDETDSEASAIGAVNVVKVLSSEGKVYLKGFNSDVIGFVDSLKPLLAPHHQKALVLGTGGASRAIRYGLTKLGLSYQMVSRRKAEGCLLYSELSQEIIKEHTVIVNCTPCGMYPKVDECPDIPYQELNSTHLLYDLTYNPGTTLFMKKGLDQGAQVKNGLEMLILQAKAAWDFWNK